ncbi:MAG TPA: AMP-binding protein, partial [Cytophagaceae bacterium]
MKITINNKVYYPEEIISTNLAQITGFEKAVIEFAKDWLTGKEQFIIPTSGSTGVPKPITVTRGQMEYSALQTVNALNLKKGNTALLCLNPEFIAGKMMLVRAFVRELDLVVVAPSSNPVLDIHEDTVIDFAALVPMQVQTILDSTSNNVAKLESMKSVIIGGAPINPVLLDRIKKLKANFYATYGMTETLSHIALKKLNGTEASDQFIAFEGVKLGQDARGCLTINSPVTLNNTITTNDVVELLSPSA